MEALYDGKACFGEGPIYDHVTGELIWVDIFHKTVNFLNVETKQNRFEELRGNSRCCIVSKHSTT